MSKQYFPQGIAKGDAFCNRDQEREYLQSSFNNIEHTVLVAPRRYGKTSLITQVLQETNYPSTHIDFFFSLTQSDVNKAIAEGVSHIISQLLPKTKKACHKMIDAVSALNPKLTFNLLGQKLEVNTHHTSDKTISELLLALEHFARQSQKTCVIVLDEFQQIGELEENHSIEASVRHAVERSDYVSYIFCGNRQHLLSEMFKNKTRPLYHLCDLMTIERISTACYQEFLKNKSIEKWQSAIDNDAINEIIHLTENHPYYVNVLCRQLWRLEAPPTIGEVRQAWIDYIERQTYWMINDLSLLSLNRKKVLTGLAYQPTQQPQGKQFSALCGLPPSSVKKSLNDLIKLDMVYIDSKNMYRMIDPALAYFLREHQSQ